MSYAPIPGCRQGELDKAVAADWDQACDRARARRSRALPPPRGLLWSMLQEPDKAIADYSRAITLDPGNVDSYLKRGEGKWSGKNEHEAKRSPTIPERSNSDPKCTGGVSVPGQGAASQGRSRPRHRRFHKSDKAQPRKPPRDRDSHYRDRCRQRRGASIAGGLLRPEEGSLKRGHRRLHPDHREKPCGLPVAFQPRVRPVRLEAVR